MPGNQQGRKRTETLEETIRRLDDDCRREGLVLTPRRLALAIAAQGWTHRYAVPALGNEKPEKEEEPAPKPVRVPTGPSPKDRATAKRINDYVTEWHRTNGGVDASDIRKAIDRTRSTRK